MMFYNVVSFSQVGICPDPKSPRKKMASSFHSSVMIDYNDSILVWGDKADWTTRASGNLLSPTILTRPNIQGKGISVAASSRNYSDHQLFVHTSEGIYGWGYSDNLISSISGTEALTKMSLPTGITIDSVNFIEAGGGTLAIVTHGGQVFIKSRRTNLVYGNGSSSINTNWNQVKINSSTNLIGIIRISVSSRGIMALNSLGNVFVWGNKVYLGNGSDANDYNFATEMTLPTGISVEDVNVNTKYAYSATVATGIHFILTTTGDLFGLGEGYHGALGQGNETDHKSWVKVKNSDGSGYLNNVISISSNNPHVLSENATSLNQSYSIGALTANGNIYLWGDNNYDMIGGDTISLRDSTFYTVPRLPPNFSFNNARLGFFEMGGHTTAAFLLGENKFCYIGHKVRGSMGDGLSTDETRKSFDCISTPDAYVCPPGDSTGCPVPSANDILASSGFGVITINGTPAVNFWGGASNSDEPGINILEPKVLREYTGIARGVAASAVSISNVVQSNQMWLKSDSGIYGWGYSANTIISNRAGVVPMVQLELPVGITIDSVNFIRSSHGGLALITKKGKVYIRAGNGSLCDSKIFADGSTSKDAAGSTIWHKVKKSDGSDLDKVIEMGFGGSTAMVITSDDKVFVWGKHVYQTSGSGSGDLSYPTELSLHSDFTTSSIKPKKVEIVQNGSMGATQFVLGSNNILYSIGRNTSGALGINSSDTTLQTNTWQKINQTGIRTFSVNNQFTDGIVAVAALTYSGNAFVWGSNKNGMLGLGATLRALQPQLISALANNVNNLEVGSSHTLIFPKSTSRYYLAGLINHGLAGDNSTSNKGVVSTFTQFGSVISCASAAFNIRGNVFEDNNGIKDSIVNGTKLNSIHGKELYINVVDEFNNVIDTQTVKSSGEFEFLYYPFGTYKFQLTSTKGTMFQPMIANTIPDNWVYTGEQLGVQKGIGINSVDSPGLFSVSVIGNLNNINFGVQSIPISYSDTLNVQNNPEGTATINITSHFNGTDTNGIISNLIFRTFPTNITSISIDGVVYTSSNWSSIPTGGLIVPFGTPILIDPIDGEVTPVIEFKVIDNAGFESSNTGAVVVPLNEAAPLSVSLISFTASKQDDLARLDWRYNGGNQTVRFELLHAIDGKNWKTIHVQKNDFMNNVSDFGYDHRPEYEGLQYYKLKIVDLSSNKIEYSVVKTLYFTQDFKDEIAFFPNPATDFLIVKNLKQNCLIDLRIYNLKGEEVLMQHRVCENEKIDMKELQRGVYLLRATSENGNKISSKITLR